MEMLLDACEDEEQNLEASLTAQDCDGNTSLHYAYAFGLAQISNLLEERMDDAVRSFCLRLHHFVKVQRTQ